MSDSQDEISTEPGLAPQKGAGSQTPSSGQSSSRLPSQALLLLKAAHVVGAVALTGYNLPWAQKQYEAGDWKPIAAVAVVAVLIATRAGFADVWTAVRSLLPWGKGGSK
jgi:hypothetical protein